MNKNSKKSLIALITLLSVGGLSGCKKDDDKQHTHDFGEYLSNNDATCTEDGTKTAKCKGCEETDTVVDTGSKKGHSFTNYVSNNDATCTNDGTKTAKCDRCNETDTVADTGSKKGHSFTNYVSNNDATCTNDGTKTAKCDRCDETDTVADTGSKKGHTFATTYSHDNEYHWYEATCGCDVISGKEAHSYGDPVIVEATSQKSGTKTFTCKCGFSYFEEIPYVFTERVVSDATLRSPATCSEPASYYYSDKDGNLGKEYFYEGETIDHKLSYAIENGRAKIVCDNCDFDSSKDYSDKADNELTNENLCDIIFNSSFALRSYGKDFEDKPVTYYDYLTPTLINGVTEYSNGDRENTYFSKVFQVDNANVYGFEEGCCYEDNGEYSLDITNKILCGEKNDILDLFGIIYYIGSLDFAYNAEKDVYESNFFNSYYQENTHAEVKIQNKKIVSYNVWDNDNLISELVNEEIPQDVINAINNEERNYVTNSDGVYTMIIEGNECPHKYRYHTKDDTHDRAYMACEYCGFTSLDCGDYSNADDDKLTKEQLTDLILNTEMVYRCYNKETNLPYQNNIYYFNNGFSLQTNDNLNHFYFEIIKNINDYTLYYEYGDTTGSTKESIQTAYVLNSNQYSPRHVLDSFGLAKIDFEYDPEIGKYIHRNDGSYTTIEVQDGKIVEVVYYDEYSDYIYKTDFDSLSIIDEYLDEFSTPFLKVEDNSTSGGRIYFKYDDGTAYDDWKSYGIEIGELSSAYKQFIKDNYGYEIEPYFNYMQVDTNNNTLTSFNLDSYSFYFSKQSENGEFRFSGYANDATVSFITNSGIDCTNQEDYIYDIDFSGNMTLRSKKVIALEEDTKNCRMHVVETSYKWSKEKNDYVFEEKSDEIRDIADFIVYSSYVYSPIPGTDDTYLLYSYVREAKEDYDLVTIIENSLDDSNKPYIKNKKVSKYVNVTQYVYSETYVFDEETKSLIPATRENIRWSNGYAQAEVITQSWSKAKNEFYISEIWRNERIDNIAYVRQVKIAEDGTIISNNSYNECFGLEGYIIYFNYDVENNEWIPIE